MIKIQSRKFIFVWNLTGTIFGQIIYHLGQNVCGKFFPVPTHLFSKCWCKPNSIKLLADGSIITFSCLSASCLEKGRGQWIFSVRQQWCQKEQFYCLIDPGKPVSSPLPYILSREAQSTPRVSPLQARNVLLGLISVLRGCIGCTSFANKILSPSQICPDKHDAYILANYMTEPPGTFNILHKSLTEC